VAGKRGVPQGGIILSLYGKYRAKVHSRDEAKGFVSGIEAVLSACWPRKKRRIAAVDKVTIDLRHASQDY